AKNASDAPKNIAAVIRADLYALHLVRTLVPLKEKPYALAPLGELKIGTQETVGVKISRKGHADVDLYFDKQSGLPVKCAQLLKETKDGPEVSHEFFFSDYKQAGGFKLFTKIILKRDDKMWFTLTLSDVKGEEKLDGSLFVKP